MNLLQVFVKLPTNARRLFSEILLKGSQKWKRNHFLIGLIAKIFPKMRPKPRERLKWLHRYYLSNKSPPFKSWNYFCKSLIASVFSFLRKKLQNSESPKTFRVDRIRKIDTCWKIPLNTGIFFLYSFTAKLNVSIVQFLTLDQDSPVANDLLVRII